MKPLINFAMMCGLPASGKSTWAKEFAKRIEGNVHSSDELRKELFGDVNMQDKNEVLFTELHKRIINDLKNGKSCVYDACNIDYKQRMRFLKQIRDIDCVKHICLTVIPYEKCIKNNNERDRIVPQHIIDNMRKNFYLPYYYEGWDSVVLCEKPFDYFLYGRIFNSADGITECSKYHDFNQCNSHHSLTLGEHMYKAYEYIGKLTDSSVLKSAALIHDIGKIYTKSFRNHKGEITENAHYYQHHLVGAYESLFSHDCRDKLLRAMYIQWHMQPYWFEKEKTKEKYRKLWGDDLYNDIMLLHEADINAH